MAVAVVIVVALVRTHHLNRFGIIYFCVLVPSIILHEVSHGAVAYAFGDDTAKRAGRLTLNPIPHIDPLGSIILPAIFVLSGNVAIGYAKPVPVNVSRLRHPRNESVLVSLAGPGTNAVIFVACALAFRLSLAHGLFLSPTSTTLPLGYQILLEGGLVNITLGMFNLIPLPPLDGSAVIERLLPARAIPRYYRLRPFGMVVVLLFALLVFRQAAVETHFLDAELRLWNAVAGSHF